VRSFCPPKACAEHAPTGASRSCSRCQFFRGIVAVKPVSCRPFLHADGENTYHVIRTQFPITPERASTIYTLQGTTTDPGMICHWTFPKRLSKDVLWLSVYVALSRVRALSRLKSVGLGIHIRKIIEQGPPENLLQCFQRLFGDKEDLTEQAANAAAIQLGWKLDLYICIYYDVG